MTEYSFFYPRRQLSSALARRAFFARRSRTPIAAEIEAREYSEDRDILVVRAHSCASGALYVPNVDASGRLFFTSTATLPPNKEPRPLYLELARGQLSLFSQKITDWHALGFRAHAVHYLSFKRCVRRFARLVCRDSAEPKYDRACVKLFCACLELNRRVNELFLSNVLEARRLQARPWKTRFGFCAPLGADWPSVYDPVFDPNAPKRRRVKQTDPFFKAFYPDFTWTDVEKTEGEYRWDEFDAAIADASERDLSVTIGPLVRWGERYPEFTRGYSAEQMETRWKSYLRALFERSGGRVKRWIVATNVESNIEKPSLEDRLTFAVQTASAIRKTFPQAQAFLGFEQPFGDSAFFERQSMGPWELASKVAKKRIFDGFYLEMNIGTAPNSTFPRDPMELHRFFDRWCSLGLPISLGISCPSASAYHSYDAATLPFSLPSARETFRSFFRIRGRSTREEEFLTQTPEESEFEALWNEANQRETIREIITSALSRRNVDEIVWTRLVDSKIVEPTAELTQAHKTKPSDRKPAYAGASYEDDSLLLTLPNAESDANMEISLDDEYANDPTYFELQLDGEPVELAEEEDLVEPEPPNERRNSNFDPRADHLSTSGLFDANLTPKPILYKLAATKRSYID